MIKVVEIYIHGKKLDRPWFFYYNMRITGANAIEYKHVSIFIDMDSR